MRTNRERQIYIRLDVSYSAEGYNYLTNRVCFGEGEFEAAYEN